jgi:hypothetical protein
LSGIIADNDALQTEWIKYTEKFKEGYLKQILNLKKYERLLLRLGLFRKKILFSPKNAVLKNLISCESHRDIISEILKKEK